MFYTTDISVTLWILNQNKSERTIEYPVIIEIDKIDGDFEPYNKTIKPTDYWS